MIRIILIIGSLIAISACSVQSKAVVDQLRHNAASASYAAVCGLTYSTERWLMYKHQISRKEFQAYCGRKDAR